MYTTFTRHVIFLVAMISYAQAVEPRPNIWNEVNSNGQRGPTLTMVVKDKNYTKELPSTTLECTMHLNSKGICSQENMRLTLLTSGLNPSFLLQYFKTDFVTREVTLVYSTTINLNADFKLPSGTAFRAPGVFRLELEEEVSFTDWLGITSSVK